MDPKGLYSVLDLTPNASVEDIKKKYKQKAIEWHPDKRKDDKERAQEMFVKVSTAYKILSNPESKEKYDRTGRTPDDQNHDGGDHMDTTDAYEIFSQFFGGNIFDVFGSFMNMGMGVGMDDMFMDMGNMQNRFQSTRGNRGGNSSQVFSSFSSSKGGRSGFTSTSTVTRTVNGPNGLMTVTETVTNHPDGTQTRTTSSNNNGIKETQQRTITNNSSGNNNRLSDCSSNTSNRRLQELSTGNRHHHADIMERNLQSQQMHTDPFTSMHQDMFSSMHRQSPFGGMMFDPFEQMSRQRDEMHRMMSSFGSGLSMNRNSNLGASSSSSHSSRHSGNRRTTQY